MSTCRSGRICDAILRSWGLDPMSSIRSASSMTRYVTRFRFVLPCSKWSIKRPGVAITISTPDCKSRTWRDFGTPPYTTVFFICDESPNLSHSSLICTSSSRVGANTNTMCPSPGFRYCRGKKKEHIGKTKIILTRYKISCLKSRTELSRGGGIWVDFDFVSVVEIDDQ